MEGQINVDEICRLCLRVKTQGIILLSITETQQNKFEEITNFKLNLDIGFPTRTCSDCGDHLENFYFYKNQLLRKQNELLQVLKISPDSQQSEELIRIEEGDESDYQQTEFIDETEGFPNEVLVDEARCQVIQEDEEMIEMSDSPLEQCEQEQSFEEIEEDGATIEQEEFLDEIEELEDDYDDEFPISRVPRRDDVAYEKVKPQLILTPNFLKAREALKKLPSDERENDKPDYSTCVVIGSDFERTTFTCNNLKCNVELASQEEMKHHLFDHKFDSGPQKCDYCSLTFKTRNFYEKHIESVHSQQMHICQICGRILDSRIKLRSHLRNHDQTLKYKCNYAGCQKAFRVKHHLDNHMRMHTKDSPFRCEFEGCSARFRQKHALTIHMRKHNGDFLLCKQCKSPFVTQFQLGKHLEKCNGKFRPLKTRAASSSKVRKDSESSTAVFKCSVIDCSESFKAKVTLEKHLTKVHQINVTPTTCILCCEEFESPQALKSHLRNHLPFTCMLCSVNFKNKENYNNHMMKSHEKDEVRMHQCSECHASFKRAEHLRTHIAYKHNTLRPFSCDSCSYQSPTRNDLNSHMKTHKTNLLTS